MKFFVPACGDRITLTKSWAFDLYLESRNMKFAVERGLASSINPQWDPKGFDYMKVRASVPAGTVLECDRIYIRIFSKSAISNAIDYDSITWKVISNGKAAKGSRFWVKLLDTYSIDFKLKDDSLYRNRVKLVREVHDL